MEAKIINKEDRPLLRRQEIGAEVSFEGPVPSRLDIRKELSKAASAKEDLVVIRKIEPVFGGTKADVSAFIYEDQDSMKRIEGSYMLDRHKEKSAEQEAESKEEQPRPEKADESKEEPAGSDEKEEEQKEEAKEEQKEQEEDKPKGEE